MARKAKPGEINPLAAASPRPVATIKRAPVAKAPTAADQPKPPRKPSRKGIILEVAAEIRKLENRTMSAAAAKAQRAKNTNNGKIYTRWTLTLEDQICKYIAECKSLTWICAQPGMPEKSTIMAHRRDNDRFHTKYARAKELQLDCMEEEIFEIADDGTNDWMATQHGDKVDRECVDRSKLRVIVRQWSLEKRRSKVFGKAADITLKGDPNAPLTTRTIIVPAKNVAETSVHLIETEEIRES